MARRPYRETQAASVASYAICSDRRARISPRWRRTRRRSSSPCRRPSLRHPSRNILRWQRRAPIPPSSVRSWRIVKPQLRCPSPHLSDRRAPSRRARPRSRRLPCLVARRRPFLPEASRITSVLGVKRDRQSCKLLEYRRRCSRADEMLSNKPAAGHHARLWQFVVALAEALQANREADAFFGRLEDDEGRGLAGAQLLEQIVIHDYLGNAPTWQAAELVQGAGRRITAHLPVIVDRLDRALRVSAFDSPRAGCQCHGDESQRQSHCANASP